MQENTTPSPQETELGLEMQEIERKSPIINIASPRHRSALKKILLSFLVAQTLFYTSYAPGIEPETRVVEIPKEIRDRTQISQTHVEIKFQGREPVFGIGNKVNAEEAGLADDDLMSSNGNGGTGGMWQSAAMGAAMGMLGGIPIGNNVKYTFSSAGAVQSYVICNTSNTSPEVGSDARLTCICHVMASVGSCIPPVMSKTVQYTEGGNHAEGFKFATWRKTTGPDPVILWGAAESSVSAVVYDGSTSLAYDFGTGGSTWGDGGGYDAILDGGFTEGGSFDSGLYDSGYGDGGFYSTDPTSSGSGDGNYVSAKDPYGSGVAGGMDGLSPSGYDDGYISDGGDIKSDTGSDSFGNGINDILNDKGSSFNAGDDDWANSNTGLGDIGDYLDSAFTDEDVPSNLTNDLLGLDEDFLNSVSDILDGGEFDADGNPLGGGIFDADGNYIGDGLGSEGYYDEYGNYIGPGGYDENGNFVGPGGMYDENGNYVGPGGYDKDGNFVGAGGLYDADGNYVGPGGYDENGNFVGEGGMYDKYGNYVGNGNGSGNGSFNANPDNPFAMLQSMLGLNGTDSNSSGSSLFGDLANSSLVNNNPLLKSIFGGNEEEIAKNTISNQELFEKAFKFLKGMGLSNDDILKGRTYDPNSAWTDPKQAWDFNRITTLLRRHQVKVNDKTGGAQAATPRAPRQRMSDAMNGGQAAPSQVPQQQSPTQQQAPQNQQQANGQPQQQAPTQGSQRYDIADVPTNGVPNGEINAAPSAIGGDGGHRARAASGETSSTNPNVRTVAR